MAASGRHPRPVAKMPRLLSGLHRHGNGTRSFVGRREIRKAIALDLVYRVAGLLSCLRLVAKMSELS